MWKKICFFISSFSYLSFFSHFFYYLGRWFSYSLTHYLWSRHLSMPLQRRYLGFEQLYIRGNIVEFIGLSVIKLSSYVYLPKLYTFGRIFNKLIASDVCIDNRTNRQKVFLSLVSIALGRPEKDSQLFNPLFLALENHNTRFIYYAILNLSKGNRSATSPTSPFCYQPAYPKISLTTFIKEVFSSLPLLHGKDFS